MITMRLITAALLILSLSACKPISQPPSDSTLILRAELREITLDLIREFRFFDTGLIEETVIYSGKPSSMKLFATKFYQLSENQTTKLIRQTEELSKTNHQNQFPWKEDFYKRGDVIKFEYAAKDGLAHTSYYYSGHSDSPEIFKTLAELIKNTGSTQHLLQQ